MSSHDFLVDFRLLLQDFGIGVRGQSSLCRWKKTLKSRQRASGSNTLAGFDASSLHKVVSFCDSFYACLTPKTADQQRRLRQIWMSLIVVFAVFCVVQHASCAVESNTQLYLVLASLDGDAYAKQCCNVDSERSVCCSLACSVRFSDCLVKH